MSHVDSERRVGEAEPGLEQAQGSRSFNFSISPQQAHLSPLH